MHTSHRPTAGAAAVAAEDQLVLRLASEPYVIYYWAEFLLPRLNDYDEFSSPQDWIIGVPGLRYRRERGGICPYRPVMPTSILLTGLNPLVGSRRQPPRPRLRPAATQTGLDTRGTRRLRRRHRLTPRSALDLLTPARRIRATAGQVRSTAPTPGTL